MCVEARQISLVLRNEPRFRGAVGQVEGDCFVGALLAMTVEASRVYKTKKAPDKIQGLI
jgi:hypothetical protein